MPRLETSTSASSSRCGLAVEKMEMEHAHIGTYEKGLMRARRVQTLRSGKQALSKVEVSWTGNFQSLLQPFPGTLLMLLGISLEH